MTNTISILALIISFIGILISFYNSASSQKQIDKKVSELLGQQENERLTYVRIEIFNRTVSIANDFRRKLEDISCYTSILEDHVRSNQVIQDGYKKYLELILENLEQRRKYDADSTEYEDYVVDVTIDMVQESLNNSALEQQYESFLFKIISDYNLMYQIIDYNKKNLGVEEYVKQGLKKFAEDELQKRFSLMDESEYKKLVDQHISITKNGFKFKNESSISDEYKAFLSYLIVSVHKFNSNLYNLLNFLETKTMYNHYDMIDKEALNNVIREIFVSKFAFILYMYLIRSKSYATTYVNLRSLFFDLFELDLKQRNAQKTREKIINEDRVQNSHSVNSKKNKIK